MCQSKVTGLFLDPCIAVGEGDSMLEIQRKAPLMIAMLEVQRKAPDDSNRLLGK